MAQSHFRLLPLPHTYSNFFFLFSIYHSFTFDLCNAHVKYESRKILFAHTNKHIKKVIDRLWRWGSWFWHYNSSFCYLIFFLLLTRTPQRVTCLKVIFFSFSLNLLNLLNETYTCPAAEAFNIIIRNSYMSITHSQQNDLRKIFDHIITSSLWKMSISNRARIIIWLNNFPYMFIRLLLYGCRQVGGISLINIHQLSIDEEKQFIVDKNLFLQCHCELSFRSEFKFKSFHHKSFFSSSLLLLLSMIFINNCMLKNMFMLTTTKVIFNKVIIASVYLFWENFL